MATPLQVMQRSPSCELCIASRFLVSGGSRSSVVVATEDSKSEDSMDPDDALLLDDELNTFSSVFQ